MRDDDYLPSDTGEKINPGQARSEYEQDSREELRWGIEAMVDAQFDDEQPELPSDEDNSIGADVRRAAFEADENAHERNLEGRRRARLDALDRESRARYGQPLEESFQTLANGHDEMFSNPNGFAQKVRPHFEDLNGYWGGISQQRQMEVVSVIDEFFQDKNIRSGSALERHMTAVLSDGDFQRTGDLRKDLNAAYKRALQARS
ncbi:MAG: hypothetical protein ACFCUR_20955 [Rhodomicrobiaceae bacterium]